MMHSSTLTGYGARRETYGLVQTIAPVEEPVSVAEAKLHLRVDAADEDALIGSLITAARTMCERTLNQAFVTQTWRLSLDRFSNWLIEIPMVPLRSITSIAYLDTSGVMQTVSPSTYRVDTDSRPGRVTPVWGAWWPPTRYEVNAVQITFAAGYGDATAVPEPIKQAIRLLIGHYYENREAVVTGTIATEMKVAVEALLYSQWHGSF